MISADLLDIIRRQYLLDWHGIHGISHWERVRENGLRIAEVTGAHREVVELFAYLHDAKRRNDGYDPRHGARAATFAASLAGSAFALQEADLAHLIDACRWHSDGKLVGDITVLTCWDADRLDLGRVGITPSGHRLCTDAARNPELLSWAYARSLK